MQLPAGDGGGGTTYSSISPGRMADLVSDLKAASTTLQDTTKGYQSRASALGVSNPGFANLITVGEWVDQQVPDLERRLTLARGLQETPGQTVSVREPVVSTKEAEALGRNLAQKILDMDREDPEKLHEYVAAIAPYVDDPDVMSAFYGALGSQRLETLVSYLVPHTDSADDDIRLLSEGFGTATRDPYPTADMQHVMDAFTTKTDMRTSTWPRLALLQYGDFPPAFVRDVVEANGFDELIDNDLDTSYTDFRMGFTPVTRGLSEDTLALMFGALGNNPDAARMVLGRSDVDVTELTKWSMAIPGALGTGDDIARAFQQAINAASGVDDESMGHHSDVSARFAFDYLTTLAAASPDHDVPWAMKEGIDALLASYAPEMLTGAESQDDGSRSSSMSPPEHFSEIDGIHPAFYLNPQDTYWLLHCIADEDSLSDDFDEAVGDLYNQALLHAGRTMGRDPDSSQWDVTLRRFGQLAGLQYAAQEKVRGDMDAFDAKMRGYVATVLTLGIGKVPTPTGMAGKFAWKVGSWAAKKAINAWKTGDPSQTRVQALKDQDLQASFLRHYQLASVLVEADHPGTKHVPQSLLDSSGHLRSPQEIMNDEHLLEAYEDWTDGTDDGTSGSLDELLDGGQTDYAGGEEVGRNLGGQYD